MVDSNFTVGATASPRRTDAMSGKIKVNRDTTVDTSMIEENPLNKFASFNTLFTLSALTRTEVETLSYYDSAYKPQNIIAKSGGMGGDPNANQTTDFRSSHADTGDAETRKSILPGNDEQEKILRSQLDTARSILQRGFDFIFQSVNISTVPSASNDRRLTAVTNIDMNIHEPLGLSLIQTIRGAAANAGFIDHVDAPYLLTIDYRGFDDDGKFATIDSAFQRKIPIKLTKMEIEVNKGGSIYTIKAIPFNEFGLVNRFNYVRQPFQIKSANKLSDFCKQLSKALNEQTAEEAKVKLFGKDTADQYIVTCDEKLDKAFVELKTLESYAMDDLTFQAPDDQFNFDTPPDLNKKGKQPRGQIAKGTAIHELLIQAMKSIKPYDDFKFFLDQWATKADGELAESIDKLASEDAKAKFVRDNEDKFYVDWFRIQTTITLKKDYDTINKMHAKIIHYHIEPYKIHILNFAQPGLHSRFRDLFLQNRKFVARKRYDYIFTGQNTEVLDMNIRYNVAYFASRFKALQQQQYNTDESPEKNTIAYGSEEVVEADLPHRASPSVGKTANVGLYGINEPFDHFLDAFTNPDGDMVTVDLEIRGDPTYLSANQYNVMRPPTNSNTPEGPGTYLNVNRSKYAGGTNVTAYDDRTRSFNLNQAEPFILINFKAPVDIDLNTGMYDIGNADQVVFNGLYRVVKIENVFDRGMFKQILRCVRMKDQGKRVSVPKPITYGSDTLTGNVNDIDDIYSLWDEFLKDGQKDFDITGWFKEKIDKVTKIAKNLINTNNGSGNNGGPPQVP